MLAALALDWGDSVGVWWVASNDNEDEEQVRRTALQRRIGPVLRDEGHMIADRYGALTTPHLFIIDERGILRYAGALDDVSFRQRVPTRNYLAEAIGALLRGQAPDPTSTAPYGCAIVRRPAGARDRLPVREIAVLECQRVLQIAAREQDSCVADSGANG